MALPLAVNVRSLVLRRTATLLTVGGIGLVIMALVIVWGLAAGLRRVFTTGGSAQVLVVLRDGSRAETTSGILEENVRIIEALEGIDRGPGGAALASPELVVLINQERRGDSAGDEDAGSANVIVRGLGPAGIALRPEFRLVEGRLFEPGQDEVIVAQSMAERFRDCGLGETLVMRKRPFRVVGLFTAEGSPYSSEIWGDRQNLGAAHSRTGGCSSILVRVSDPIDRARLRETLEEDRRLGVTTLVQSEYFGDQAAAAMPMMALGTLMTVFLSIGACFAAANTAYASVLSRSREIGTLRALGFSRLSILVSYVLESAVVSVAGGVLGLLLGAAALTVAGTSGTSNWVTFSEVTFSMRITPAVVVFALVASAVIGVVGGFLPALRAARMKIVDALRAG